MLGLRHPTVIKTNYNQFIYNCLIKMINFSHDNKFLGHNARTFLHVLAD